jgi:HAD superfamily hydrolase (TIGR01490 family)
MGITESTPPTAAFFDVDGTLVDSTIVNYYVYFRRRRKSRLAGGLWFGLYLLKCLYFIVIDKLDRSRFNRVFYRDYRGLSAADIDRLAGDCFQDVIHPRCFAQGVECVREHQRQGRTVVLVTGSLDFIMRPLAEVLDVKEVLAASLAVHDGRFTGELATPPVCDGEKARRIRRFAEEQGIDLSQSYAYGDSIADLAMLEIVGFPQVVNPDRRLSALAQARNWPIYHWTFKSAIRNPQSALV